MDNGPTDEEYLSSCANDVKGPQRACVQAQVSQLKAMKQMNRANESAMFSQIMASITAAKAQQ